ncbi:protein kinase domain-containing protein [Cryptosporidium serpentis]
MTNSGLCEDLYNSTNNGRIGDVKHYKRNNMLQNSRNSLIYYEKDRNRRYNALRNDLQIRHRNVNIYNNQKDRQNLYACDHIQTLEGSTQYFEGEHNSSEIAIYRRDTDIQLKRRRMVQNRDHFYSNNRKYDFSNSDDYLTHYTTSPDKYGYRESQENFLIKGYENNRYHFVDGNHQYIYNRGYCNNIENKAYYDSFNSSEASSVNIKKDKKKYDIKASNFNEDDDTDHFVWHVGQYLTPRYRVIGLAGEGTFGRVFECEDLKRKRKVAIKVVRNVQRYTEAAKIEAEILRDIALHDEFGTSYCVMLHNAFLYNTHHMCLVFEKLGPSLYDFLGGNCARGFLLADIQSIAEQMLWALAFLRKMKLTHTDLKLENILLVESGYIWVNAPRHPGSLIRRPIRSEIRLIDFGSATYDDDYHGSIINTRQYRAPEVILDIGWDMSSDMWSFGCILMELYTGVLLFKTHEHLEHLAMMEEIIGPFPQYMFHTAYMGTAGKKYVVKTSCSQWKQSKSSSYKKGKRSDYFKQSTIPTNYTESCDYEYQLYWEESHISPSSFARVQRCQPIEDYIHSKHKIFASFVRYILNLDPKLRPTPEMALKHEFFKTQFEEEI